MYRVDLQALTIPHPKSITAPNPRSRGNTNTPEGTHPPTHTGAYTHAYTHAHNAHGRTRANTVRRLILTTRREYNTSGLIFVGSYWMGCVYLGHRTGQTRSAFTKSHTMYFDIISANTQEEIKDELYSHATEVAKTYGKDLDEWTEDELHHAAFNEDYYIIGYHKASQWLKKYGIPGFEAVCFVQRWEREHFGEAREYDNLEATVNMIAYILGYEVVPAAIRTAERESMDPFRNITFVNGKGEWNVYL